MLANGEEAKMFECESYEGTPARECVTRWAVAVDGSARHACDGCVGDGARS